MFPDDLNLVHSRKQECGDLLAMFVFEACRMLTHVGHGQKLCLTREIPIQKKIKKRIIPTRSERGRGSDDGNLVIF